MATAGLLAAASSRELTITRTRALAATATLAVSLSQAAGSEAGAADAAAAAAVARPLASRHGAGHRGPAECHRGAHSLRSFAACRRKLPVPRLRP